MKYQHHSVGRVKSSLNAKEMGRQNMLTLFIILHFSCKAQACLPYFVIPDDQTVAEGTKETFRFSVYFNGTENVRSCLENKDVNRIAFSYINDTGADLFTPCLVDLNPESPSRICNRTCSWTDRGVDCALTMIFYRNTTRWRLQAVIGIKIPQKIFTINVIYPTELTGFGSTPPVQNGPLDAGSDRQLELYCSWKKGNPSRAVRIYNRPREIPFRAFKSNSGPDYGGMAGIISPVTCDSSGVYTCEVEGQLTARNLTVFVRCPPIFKALQIATDTSIGGSAEFRFIVQSHTSHITSCNLNPPLPIHAGCNHYKFPCDSFRSRLEVKGEPWELSLTLWLSNITECDVGAWSLSLTNDFTGQMDNVSNPAIAQFSVKILDIPQEPTCESATPAPWAAIGGAGAALIIVTSVVSFIVGRQSTKKGITGPSIAVPSKATRETQQDSYGYLKPCPVVPRVQASPTADVGGADGNVAGVYAVIHDEAKQGGGQYDVLKMSEVELPSAYDSIKH